MANTQSHEAILFNTIISTAVQDELKHELKRLGYNDLAPSHFMLLYIVYKNGGRIQIKCICDTMLKQKSTITEMIIRLVKTGYLVKEGHSEDKRVTYAVATKKHWMSRHILKKFLIILQRKCFMDSVKRKKLPLLLYSKKC